MKISLLLLIVTSLYSQSIDNLLNLFEKGEFKTVCQEGMGKVMKGNIDEDFIGVVGIACAEVDYINPLGIIQKSLKSTKNGRENAVYFSNLILQKKLIYHFMVDGRELSYLRLPDSSHILSVIFRHLSIGKYKTIKESPKEIEFSEDGKTYKLTLSVKDKPNKVFVDVYDVNGKKIESHWYR
jgi:hypothetical protein